MAILSVTCKYAIRAAVYIAVNEENGKRLGIRQVSEDLQIPFPFLGKILQAMARNKILCSSKGPRGGFGFLKPADKTSLSDIVLSIDGPAIFKDCIVGLEICQTFENGQDACPFHKKMGPVQEQLLELFASHTIAQIAKDTKMQEYFLHI